MYLEEIMGVIKKLLFFTLVISSCSVFACTCKKNNVEAVAHTSEIVLTKVKVSTPSITEWARSFLPTKSNSRIYSVKVVENYKGEYTENTISVNTNIVGSGGCGVSVDYGDTLNVVAYKSSEGITSNGVSICNLVSDEFAQKVKKEIKNPNEAFSSVDTNSWHQFHKNNSQTYYAETKRVTKDEYGSYIWVLMNDSSVMKSQRSKIHISCKEKMFIIDKEVTFNDLNAKGKIFAANNFDRQKDYQWQPLTDLYLKLLSYTC